jgi:peptidoglycan hydrolase-like protein with peptidoglycan-binding domain
MAHFLMAAKNEAKYFFTLLIFGALCAPLSFAFAENTYGECDYGNETYNESCPAQTRPKTGRSGNPLPVTSFSPQVLSQTVFQRDLQIGSEGNDVMALQKLLNSLGFQVAPIGPGSSGSETLRFGAATRAALIRFQIARNISPAAGYFGPLTRAALTGVSTTPASLAIATTTLSNQFARNLYQGDTGKTSGSFKSS